MSNLQDVLHWLVDRVTRDGTVAAELVAELHEKIDAALAAVKPNAEAVADPYPTGGNMAEPDDHPAPAPEPDTPLEA
jgi:hypothetical protein